MLNIESLRCWLVDISTIRPHKLSMATMGCQTLTIVEMTCNGGVKGWGEATTIGGLSYGPESPEGIKSAIETYLAPLICGREFSGVEALSATMNASVKGNTFAKSALETAFLDAQGKLLGVPVSTLLGGALTTRLPVLWTLASGKTESDIEEGKRLLAEGRHNTFKLKIGARSLREDVRHVIAIKEALGEEVSIRVDVNQAWDMSQAVKGIAELQAGNIDLIEQPVPVWNHRDLITLSQRFDVQMLADESVATLQDSFALANGGFTGAWALKIAKAGGPAQVLKLAHVAQGAGIGLYGGTMLEGTLGTVASLHAWSTMTLQWGTEMFGPLLLKDDIIANPLRFEDSGVTLPSGPGLGIEIDLDKLNHYSRK